MVYFYFLYSTFIYYLFYPHNPSTLHYISCTTNETKIQKDLSKEIKLPHVSGRLTLAQLSLHNSSQTEMKAETAHCLHEVTQLDTEKPGLELGALVFHQMNQTISHT